MYSLCHGHVTLHLYFHDEQIITMHLLVLQVQQMLKASEGVESYTDATPLRLLPCDGACQKAKASTCASPLFCSIINTVRLLACLFMLLKPALLMTKHLQPYLLDTFFCVQH